MGGLINRGCSLNIKSSVVYSVPYFSQWESRHLIEDIAYKKIDASEDPLWMNSGADSAEEYGTLSRHACGMACLKMILAFKRNKELKTIKLLKECMQYDGYVVHNEDIKGLYYEPFSKYVKDYFQINSRVVKKLSIEEIVKESINGALVMASVNKEIRKPNITPSKKGGHLILVVGVNVEENRIIFHNPSGHQQDVQAFTNVTFETFDKFFAYRGIVIY